MQRKITKITTFDFIYLNIKIRFKITHAALQINSAIIIPQQGKTATILIITVIPQ